MPKISLKLKETLLFREELMEEYHEHRVKAKNLYDQLDAVNKLLESFGIMNFTSFDPRKKFNAIIDTSKNTDFFK